MARPREFDEEVVLDAIMKTFWRHGYEGTTAQHLVDATGLGRGSLYAAYSDKQGFFEQALMRYRREAQSQADRLQQPGLAADRLREMMLHIIDSDLNAPETRGCLATNSAVEMATRDPRIAQLVAANFAVLTNGIEQVILRGQKTGEITDKADASDLAFFILNTVQGLRVLARVSDMRDRNRLCAVIDQCLEVLK